jgi:hypothetical protein
VAVEDTAADRQPGPASNEPVGRVNLPETPDSGAPAGLAPASRGSWSAQDLIVGVIALAIIVAGMFVILQGAYQITAR